MLTQLTVYMTHKRKQMVTDRLIIIHDSSFSLQNLTVTPIILFDRLNSVIQKYFSILFSVDKAYIYFHAMIHLHLCIKLKASDIG